MTTTTKYEVVRTALLDLIAGETVGTAIPPERQLAEQLGVSRMTLRRVIGDLVFDGFLTRRQGSGTFVGKPKIAQQLTMTSFSEDMRRRGFRPSARTLSLEVTSAGARIGRWLDISPTAHIVRARRLRLADEETMAIETLHVPEELVPGLTRRDLDTTSFYDLLRERYGVALGGGRQTIEPTLVDEEEAAILDVPVHSPAFLFERVTRDTDERPVEFVHSLYRGDRYQLVTDLHPQNRGSA
ncbi:GntR family transcriptional regulator [Nitriliruptor alkaliphilus]|uniref:GntR family transcriptional regulator n=1 Tax=Nitriliruptor alkaliphilus TaxID=427918 RepID=UPI00069655A5|nr:GntR family transcriptional regulator [Nitriliruptor alkaliphilus]